MWGTDLTTAVTGEGPAAVFVAIDHCSAECVGIHADRNATRFQPLEPVRQGVPCRFGGFAKGIAHDRCAERFIRTLKENLLRVRTFDSVKDLRVALLEFRDIYNTAWLIERHGLVRSIPSSDCGRSRGKRDWRQRDCILFGALR